MSQTESAKKIQLNKERLQTLICRFVYNLIDNKTLFKGGVGYPVVSGVKLSDSGFGDCRCLLPGALRQKVHLNVSRTVDECKLAIAIIVTHSEEDGKKSPVPDNLKYVVSLDDGELGTIEGK